MDFSIKNVLIIIFSLFFAFTLYWFIQFGTVFWFLNSVGNEISKSNAQLLQKQQTNNALINEQKRLFLIEKEKEQKRRVFISSGDYSKKIPIKEKLCNEAILRAMSDKSNDAKLNKKKLCDI